jgi:predicted transposase YdaD
MNIDELRDEILRLPPKARAELAREPLSSLDELSDAEVERLWLDEATLRPQEIESGAVDTLPADEVLALVRARRR